MIDDLCIDQLDVCRLLRNAAQRGDRLLVALLLRSWTQLDKGIKHLA